ncbi:Uncharacterised protein [Vibrio cholerae]|nr:Uncharacterised protein [Vibrio cholerae]CSI76347.1 Uncharacterised protein [Vibrio cholerae]
MRAKPEVKMRSQPSAMISSNACSGFTQWSNAR